MQDFWNARYREADYAYGIEPNDFLKSQSKHLKKGSKILTLAEGEGRNAVFLANRGAIVTAVDYAEAGRQKALALADSLGLSITYLVQDLSDMMVVENKWDAIVAIFAHTPPAVRDHMFKYARQALKPGGLFILEGYTPAQIGRGTGGPPNADMMFSKQMLDDVFQDFEIQTSVEKLRNIQEGAHHCGKGAIVQFIARKRT